jgi:hypothetical protein
MFPLPLCDPLGISVFAWDRRKGDRGLTRSLRKNRDRRIVALHDREKRQKQSIRARRRLL